MFFIHIEESVLQEQCGFIKESQILWESMEPLMLNGTDILVHWNYYDCNPITRWDIVLIYLQSFWKTFIKTLVAVPGDRIEFKDSSMFINGKILKNSQGSIYRFNEIEINILSSGLTDSILNRDNYLVLWDNILNTFSSRKFGAIFWSQIVWKKIH